MIVSSHERALKIAGTDHGIILTRGGEMYTWGTGGQGQLGRTGIRINERHLHVSNAQPNTAHRAQT